MTDIKESLLLRFTNFLTKSLQVVSGFAAFANKSAQHKQLAEELHQPIIKNFKKRTVYSRFKDNIWSADMQLIKDLDFY